MNPYVTAPEDIPASDPYKDTPLYGRYARQSSDFWFDLRLAISNSPDAMTYLESVVARCDETLRIRPSIKGHRDVFALGSIIVKSSHLQEHEQNRELVENSYKLAGGNEAQARALAERIFGDEIVIPDILAEGTYKGSFFQIQQRLPGVTLDVAWPYLSRAQKESFKQQARTLLQRMHVVKPPPCFRARRHFVHDNEIYRASRITWLEGRLLFSEKNKDPDRAFVHNNLVRSKLIVDNDKIIGIIGWSLAGYFGWDTAAKIHRRIRCPQHKNIVNSDLSEEELGDLMWWNDLYDEGKPAPGSGPQIFNGVFTFEELASEERI